MSDVLERWVSRVSADARRRTDQVRSELAAQVADLRTRLSDVERPEELRLERVSLLERNNKLRERRDALEAELARRRAALRDQARAATAHALAQCHRYIDAVRAREDAELVAEAEALLKQPIDGMSAASLDQELQRRDLRARVRAQLEEKFAAAADATRATESRRSVADLLARERDDLAAHEVSLLRELSERHSVGAAVLSAIGDLGPAQLHRYLVEVLDPALSDAVMETGWGISADVLAEVRRVSG